MQAACNGAKGIKNFRVEMCSSSLFKYLQGFLKTEGLLIGPYRSEGVEYIGKGKDVGCQRELLTADVIRIAAACIFFVMILYYIDTVTQP